MRQSRSEAKLRHPSAQRLTPSLRVIRTMHAAVVEAWTILATSNFGPMSSGGRQQLDDAAAILNSVRRVHPSQAKYLP